MAKRMALTGIADEAWPAILLQSRWTVGMASQAFHLPVQPAGLTHILWERPVSSGPSLSPCKGHEGLGHGEGRGRGEGVVLGKTTRSG